MKQLKEIAHAQKKRRYLLYLLSVMIGAVIIGQAFFIVSIVERIFLQSESFREILPLLAGLIIMLVARSIFTYGNGRIGVKMAAEVKGDYRKSLLSRYTRNPILASLKGQSGQKVSILMDAIDGIDSYFSKYYPIMIQTKIVPFMIVVVIFFQNWVSGLIILVTAPFIPIFMIIIGGATEKKSEEQVDKLARFSGKFLDILQGLSTLKFFGRARQQKETIRQSSLDYRDATMSVLKIAFLSSLMIEFISMLSIALVALEVGLRLVVYEHLTFFTAFFVLILVPEFFASLKELGSAFHSGRGSMGAAKMITEELEEIEQPLEWGELRLEKGNQPPTIALQNVGFSYGEGKFALSQLGVTIPPYSDVAIVGRSGSGKTTLLHVISGLVGTSVGSILVNERPLFDYQEADWFDQLSYISQDPYLFSGTIEENITIGRREKATRIEVERAAEKAGILELIENLEDKYETRIGEGGRGLSGGEKQRIALARAFLKKPSVILFDEPTVGLDLHTERILQRSIEELARAATVITVAHRLYTIKKAKQILFLDDGELVAQGTHDELIISQSEYRKMVLAQRGDNAG